MFGLMKPLSSCGSCQPKGDYKQHRQHYCGTCKVIGKEYGHSARMTLNFDAVFLAELLTALSGEQVAEWSSAFQAINRCFTMPKADENMPLPLRYAAATNVLLAELKLDDNWRDRAKKRYRVARWWLSKSFKRAEAQWQTWGVDTQFFWAQVEEQNRREKAAFVPADTLEETVNYYAETTAEMTGQIFAHSVGIVVQDESLRADLYQIGANIGRLMYALDAFEDVEKDIFERGFNPLAAFFGATQTLDNQQFEQMRQHILALSDAIKTQIEQLPLSAASSESFVARLQSNLAMRLYKERVIPTTFAQRVAMRWQNARQKAADFVCARDSWARQLRYHFVSIAIFLLPQAAYQIPQEMRGQTVGYLAIFTAILASIGLAKKIYAAPIEPKKQRKGLWSRFKAWRARRKQDPCLTACCECCCQSCADQSCQICCEAACDDDGCCNCANWDKNAWRIFLWVIVITLIVIGIVVGIILFL